jgi:hypothetical protein
VAQVLGYLISFGLNKRGLVVVASACLLIFGPAGLGNKSLYVIPKLSPLPRTAKTELSGPVSAQIVANVSLWGQRERRVQVHVAGRNLDKKATNLAEVVATAGDAVWSSPLAHLNSSTQGTGFIDTPNHWFNIPHQVPITLARTATRVGKVAHLIRGAIFGGSPDTSKHLWRLASSQRSTLHRIQPCLDG